MVHVFNYKDKFYIYDSGSGSLHECDKDTADYVKAKYEGVGQVPALSREKVAEIESDLTVLREQGLFLKEEVKAYPLKSQLLVKNFNLFYNLFSPSGFCSRVTLSQL